MKKVNRRAFSVLLIALLIVVGLLSYTRRYLQSGERWATYFSRLNSSSEGLITDRNGVLLASFTANDNHFNEDRSVRIANYHVTGDFWDRTGTGILASFSGQLHGYNPVTGMTQTRHISLKLNVDAELNKKAFAALADRKGAVGIVNYRTGELICMVSSPAVDPIDNDPVAAEGAYINRLLSASFVPGSIFKLVTAAAAIECVPGIWEKSFFCEGEAEVAGVKITCPYEHYTQDFAGALAVSCNIAFSRIAISVGQDNMISHVRKWGFLDTHDLDGIPTAAGAYPLEFVGDPETGWSGIGQSTDLICPYSMLRFVSAIANDGILVEPKLIDDGKAPEKSVLVEPETAKAMQTLMRNNVASNYGDERFAGLTLCAKTGTAEVGDGTTHAWFTGFLQDEEHPYAFIVFVEQGGGGLSVASPIATTVLQAAVRRGTEMEY
ncbi:MAG: penicillin-binding protein [Oscillospiraceae bacterium]|nr:penicillin-binding protein [Oscillospiraceae bacterium]